MAGQDIVTGTEVVDQVLSAAQWADEMKLKRDQLAAQIAADQAQLQASLASTAQSGANAALQAETQLKIAELQDKLDRERLAFDKLEADRQYGLDVQRFGLDVASQNWLEKTTAIQFQFDAKKFGLDVAQFNAQQRQAEAQAKLQALELLASKSGPQDWVAYNNLLNGMSAPEAQAKGEVDPFSFINGMYQPYEDDGSLMDTANSLIASAGQHSATIPQMPAASGPTTNTPGGTGGGTPTSGGGDGRFGFNFPTGGGGANVPQGQIEVTGPTIDQLGGIDTSSWQYAGPRTTFTGNPLNGDYGGPTPTATQTGGVDYNTAINSTVTGPNGETLVFDPATGGLVPQGSNAGPNADSNVIFDYKTPVPMARGGVTSADTLLVGERGPEVIRNMGMDHMGRSLLHVIPNPQTERMMGMRAAATGGSFALQPYQTLVSGGGNSTAGDQWAQTYGTGQTAGTYGAGNPYRFQFAQYSPEVMGSQPFIKKLTGQTPTYEFQGFGATLANPSLGVSGIPFGAAVNYKTLLNMNPSEQQQTKSLYEQGLGVSFADVLEQSRRAAPIGTRFGPAGYAGR